MSSSDASTERLEALGISVIDLNAAPRVDVYVDGADELNDAKQLVKGGGAALTREKIVANAADLFVCIAHGSKRVAQLEEATPCRLKSYQWPEAPLHDNSSRWAGGLSGERALLPITTIGFLMSTTYKFPNQRC